MRDSDATPSSSKFKIRNRPRGPKQIQMVKKQKTLNGPVSVRGAGFEFRICVLQIVSDLDIRISNLTIRFRRIDGEAK